MRLMALTGNIGLIRANAISAQSLLDRTLKAAGRGNLAADQVQSARIAALDAADRLRAAEKDVEATRGTLMALLGLPPATKLRLAPARTSSNASHGSRSSIKHMSVYPILDVKSGLSGLSNSHDPLSPN